MASLFEMAPPDTWECKTCTLRNSKTTTKCVACLVPKPDTATGPPSSGFVGFKFRAPSNPLADSWECKTCRVKTKPDASKCVACESRNPESSIENNTVQKDGAAGGGAAGGGASSVETAAEVLPLPESETKTSLSSSGWSTTSSQRKPTADGPQLGLIGGGAGKPTLTSGIFNLGVGLPDEGKTKQKPNFDFWASNTRGSAFQAEASLPKAPLFTFGTPRLFAENKDLSCHICYDAFDTPKVLTCGHTFCMKCIEGVIDRTNAPQLRCSTCRTDVVLPESGKAEDLATNFQLLSLITHEKAKKKNPEPEGKQSRCNAHGQENKLYCKDCKEPICFNCTLREHEVGKHKIITRKEFVEEKRKEVYTLAIELPEIRDTFNQMKGDFEKQREQYNQKREDLKGAVQGALDGKRRQLEDHANKLLKEIDQSLTGPDDKNRDFGEQLSGKESALGRAERTTETLLKALDSRDFVDASEITGISGDLTTITRDLEKLKVDLRALSFKIPLCFEPSTYNGDMKVGELSS